MSEDWSKPSPIEKKVGSCPICGTGIWTKDFTHFLQLEDGKKVAIYRCVGCKQQVNGKEAIPF